MTERHALESMSCEELLKELARLTSERDHAQAESATPARADTERVAQVASLLDQSARIDRIGELLKAKRCQGTEGS
jgi:hypothetical protein